MNSTPTPSSRWKAILLLAVIFVLGAACGVGGGLLALRRVVQHAITEPGGPNAPVDRIIAHLESSLASELDLTSDERAAIHSELETTASDFKALRVEVWQKATQNVRDSLNRVASHLPPEKRVELRKKAAQRLRPWGILIDTAPSP